MIEAPQIAVRKQSNFHWAFFSLGKEKRKALDTLYSYCRWVDDIVDEMPDPKEAQIQIDSVEKWLLQQEEPPVVFQSFFREIRHLQQNNHVELNDLLWILRGMRQDLHQIRYDTFEDLQDYMDCVASAVGLCILSILGISREEGYEYAMATGRALQLTNIIRDISNDVERNRIYVPLSEIKAYQCSEEVIMDQFFDENVKKLIESLVQKAKSFYQESEHLSQQFDSRKIRPAEIMRQTYQKLLKKIEQKNYNVFNHRVSLSPWEKVTMFIQANNPF